MASGKSISPESAYLGSGGQLSASFVHIPQHQRKGCKPILAAKDDA